MSNKSNSITTTRQVVAAFLLAWRDLKERKVEYDALGGHAVFTAAEFTGMDITDVEFYSAIVGIANIENAMGQGPQTDLYRVKS